MVDKISREQYEELCQSDFFDTTEQFNEKLEQMTGITAHRYVSYLYLDSSHNYVGNSDDSNVIDLLKNAYIEIEDD